MASQTDGNLFTRDDTFFGVCEGLGEITRIPANLFRVALAPALIWNPFVSFLGYCAVGLVVAAIRFAFPKRVRTVTATPRAEPVALAATGAEPEVEEVVLAKAA